MSRQLWFTVAIAVAVLLPVSANGQTCPTPNFGFHWPNGTASAPTEVSYSYDPSFAPEGLSWTTRITGVDVENAVDQLNADNFIANAHVRLVQLSPGLRQEQAARYNQRRGDRHLDLRDVHAGRIGLSTEAKKDEMRTPLFVVIAARGMQKSDVPRPAPEA